MKKKILLTITILAVVVLTLTACYQRSGTNVYDDLNETLTKDYTIVDLHVETTYNGVTLHNVFTSQKAANGTVVTYSVEKLATIDKNENNQYVMPENMITKQTGHATVKDGKIIEQTGDPVDIPTNLGSLSVKFKESYFSLVKNYLDGSNSVFEAKVESIKGFTGNEYFDGKDMRVTVRYQKSVTGNSNSAGSDVNVNISSTTKLTSMIIDYTTNNGAKVKVIYSFL